MSLYGYSDALSQGTAFNARVKNFNDGVLVHNQQAREKFAKETQQKANDLADDKRREEEDDAKYGFKDGTGLAGAGVGLVQAGSSIRENGFAGYVSKEMSQRANNIKNTAHAIVYGEPKPEPTTIEMNEVNAEGRVTDGAVDAERAGQEVLNAGEEAGDATKNIAQATERESSGLASAVIKKGLKFATLGKVGDAGLSAISEIGGKAIGDFSGAVDIGKNIENIFSKPPKNIFSGESTADKFQEAGAIADVAGIAFPPLEVVGGILNLTGGIMDTVKDISDDIDKKKTDTQRQVAPPKITAVKVSPAFQSMGLVASQLPSSKTQITGTGSF
mgnify:FL=1|tara:strand:- start:4423 stop:5415 length:993 start_codon:yes stop_codon:yes gene_type:complete